MICPACEREIKGHWVYAVTGNGDLVQVCDSKCKIDLAIQAHTKEQS